MPSGGITSVVRTGIGAAAGNRNAAAMAGAILDVGDEVPDAAFIDQANRAPIDRRVARFGDAGDVHLHAMPAAEFLSADGSELREDAEGGRPRMPALRGQRETCVDVIRSRARHAGGAWPSTAKHYGADPAVWTFLTGDRGTVDRFAAVMGVG